jgi:hypothetical protein
MTVSVTRVGTEPILLVTASGYLSVADMGTMFDQSLALIGADEGIFYRITDMDGMTLSFTDLPAMLTLMTSGARGSTSDPQIRTLLVGTTFHAPMLRDTLAQQGVRDVVAFESLDEALTYARAQIDGAQ